MVVCIHSICYMCSCVSNTGSHSLWRQTRQLLLLPWRCHTKMRPLKTTHCCWQRVQPCSHIKHNVRETPGVWLINYLRISFICDFSRDQWLGSCLLWRGNAVHLCQQFTVLSRSWEHGEVFSSTWTCRTRRFYCFPGIPNKDMSFYAQI